MSRAQAGLVSRPQGGGSKRQLLIGAEDDKMVAPRSYTSRFKNRYGEEWEFQYHPATGEGTLRGSDVDWEEYRVVGGLVPELMLNEEEVAWLRKAWAEATGRQ